MSNIKRKVPDFVGRPAFKVTPEVLQKVEELAATGMPKIWIARALGIGQDTFIKNIKEVAEFSDAYERGRGAALVKLYDGAMTNATTRTPFSPGGMLPAQFGLIDRIEGRNQNGQAPDNREIEEVIFRRIKPSRDTETDA